MNNKIKKFLIEYKNLIIVVVLITVSVWFFNFRDVNNNERIAIPKPSFNNFSEKLGLSVINCEFKVFSDFSFKDDGEKDKLIKYGTDNQSEPLSIVFSGLDTSTPVMKGNNGEDPLLIVANTDTEMTLASSNTFGDVFLYKIYKKQKVATWYKSYDMFGSPFALLSMGYCY
jgi:hypothetical protein